MLVRFKFNYYDEEEHKIVKESGIVEAETLGRAVDRVVECMRPNEISDIKVYECENLLFDFDLKDFLNESNI